MSQQDQIVQEQLEAARELRAEGNYWASVGEILNRVAAKREAKRRLEEAAMDQAAVEAPEPAERENPAPRLQEAPLPAIRPKRKRGRPAIEPPWYEAAAKLVAYGTSLRQALWRLGIQLTKRQRQNVYRHVAFRRHYERYRHQFILEDYGKALPSDADRIWKMVSTS